jgi:hypothetical protein
LESRSFRSWRADAGLFVFGTLHWFRHGLKGFGEVVLGSMIVPQVLKPARFLNGSRHD